MSGKSEGKKGQTMHHPQRRADLVVFLAVLLTGVVLVLCGVRPETVSTIAIGLSTLYAAWHRRDEDSK